MTGKKIKEIKGEVEERPGYTRCCGLLRVFLVALAITVLAYIVHTVEAILTMEYYIDPAYFEVWSKVMMPTAGPPPMEFAYLSLFFSFIAALIYIWAYKVVEPALERGDGWVRKGAYFGLILFLVGVLPGMFTMYLLINLPAALLGWWTLSSLVIALIDGLVISKFC